MDDSVIKKRKSTRCSRLSSVFKIDVVRVQAKFKPDQNRSREDEEKMLRNL